MKILNDKILIKQIIRYCFISIFGYGFVFLALFICVEIIKLNKTSSFILSYGLWYLFLYFVQLKLLFETQHDKKKFLKFFIYLFSFYLLANLFFNIGLHFKLNYLVATLITVIILMPFRFIVSKFYVFK